MSSTVLCMYVIERFEAQLLFAPKSRAGSQTPSGILVHACSLRIADTNAARARKCKLSSTALHLLSPPCALLRAVMSSSEVELSPSRMEAAEIETLVDGDEDSSRSNDGLPLCVRRRRLCLVCLIFIALAISVAVALGIIQGRNDMDEVSKPSKQVGSQGDETNNNVAAAPSAIMTSTPIPTASPTASPTANPTQWLPTAYPTALPVLKPTGAPPTAEMTSSPTATAVQQPTGAPPTALRTSLPTAFPTAASANEVSPFSEWYDANVTLSSGQMYEVIGDFIPHDDQAFT